MIQIFHKLSIVLSIIVIICPRILFANGTKRAEIEQMGIDEILQSLKNPNWVERASAINYGVDRFLDNDKIKGALIKLLEEEIILSEKWWQEYEETGGDINYLNKKYSKEYGYGDGYGEYEIELIDKVIKSNDRRAISVLVPVAYLGNKPTNAVAEFGRLAVTPLINWFSKTKNEHSKVGVVCALKKIVETCEFDSIVQEKSALNIIPLSEKGNIANFFISALQDSNPYVRKWSVLALVNFGDLNIISILQKVSQNDNYRIIAGEKGNIYPVREAAAEVLRKLDLKEKNK